MAPDFAGGLRVPKIGHGHSRAQKSAPQDGWAIALVWGAGDVCLPDSEWGEALRGASRYISNSHGHSRTQILMPKGRGAKRPQGHQDWLALALVRGECEVCPPNSEWAEALQGASGCIFKSHGHSCTQKYCPAGRGAKKTLGPQDGWAIALVGGTGEIIPQDSDWGEAFRGALGSILRVMSTAAAKKNCPKVGLPKVPRGPVTGGL